MKPFVSRIAASLRLSVAVASMMPWLIPAVADAQSAVTYTPVHDLTDTIEGYDSRSGLVLGSDGLLYGSTNSGGAGGMGTIFSLNPANNQVAMGFTFGVDQSEQAGGSYPSGLRRSKVDGYLYGTTGGGGEYFYGTIFRYRPENPPETRIERLYSMNCAAGDSSDPYGLLTEDSVGMLYGMTQGHSVDIGCGDGMVYKFDPITKILTRLYSLQHPQTGRFMWGPLAVGHDGSVYGTTYDSVGGDGPALGAVFRIPPGGNAFELLHVFQGPEGAYPGSGLVRGADGALYGTAEGGGANNTGVIFRITEQGSYSTLYSFPSVPLDVNGFPTLPSPGNLVPGHLAPHLLPDGSGRFFGAAFGAGQFGLGGFYEFVYDFDTGVGQFFVLHESTSAGGYWSFGFGLEHSDASSSHLFGSTASGGAGDWGVLFGLVITPKLAPFPPFAIATADKPNPVEATGPSGASVEISGSASSDVEGGVLTFEWSDLPGTPTTSTLGTLSRTFPITGDGPGTTVKLKVTDSTGNLSNTTLTVVVKDTTAPTITVTDPDGDALPEVMTPDGLLPNVTLSISGGSTVVDYDDIVMLTAFDLVTAAAAMPITCSPASGTAFALGQTTVICTATDGADTPNTGSVKFSITVKSGLPTIDVPADFTLEQTTVLGAPVAFTVTAADASGNPLPFSCGTLRPGVSNPVVSGDILPPGETLVTCETSDGEGQTVSGEFTVTVVDTTPPVVSVENLLSPQQGPNGSFIDFRIPSMGFNGPYATDLGETLPVSCTDSLGRTVVLVPGMMFPVGTTTVMCTATDSATNTGSASFVVRVNDDTPPIITQHLPETKEATAPLTPVPFAIVVVDNEGSPVTWSCTPAPNSTFGVGSTPITCTATDHPPDTAGGTEHTSAPMTFNVIVTDTTPPTLTVPTTMITAPATPGLGGAIVNFVVSATDLVDLPSAISIACSTPSGPISSGSIFPIGLTTVTCVASDSRGNASAPKSFTVKVTVGPTVTVPGPISVDAIGQGTPVSFLASAQNDTGVKYAVVCSWGARSVTFPAGSTTPLTGTFPIGLTTVSCSANDGTNTSTATFQVTVIDRPPVITVPGPITINASALGTALVSFIASARDGVNGPVPVGCTWPGAPSVLKFPVIGAVPLSGMFPVGTTTVTCTASDFGMPAHTASATFTITVTPPMLLGKFVAFGIEQTWLWARTRVTSGDVGANIRASKYGYGGHGWDDDDWNDNDHWGNTWGHNDRDGHGNHDGRHKVGAIEVRLGQSVVMEQAGSRVVGDTVWLQPHTSVYNVIDNDLIKQQGASILGTLTTGLSLPLISMPALPSSNPGTQDIVVGKNKTLTLASGRYRNVTVSQNATLILIGGVYQMQNLDLGTQATVRVLAPTEVRIRGEFDAASRASIINDPLLAPTLRASQIVFNVGGTDSDCRHGESHHGHDNEHGDDHDDAGPSVVHIGTQSTIKANIYAPGGTLWIQSRATATGAFIGKRVRIGVDSQLTLDSKF